MSYHNKSIKEIVEDIEFEKAYLPAIQRKFVWPKWKIQHLFDSIMRNYPIGSFLFWELKSDKAYEYVFYNFLKKYDERKPYNERKKGSFLHQEIIGVLDGQQRLSSMYLGLQGSHRQRLKYHKTKQDYAYPETFLFLNLLSLPYLVKDGLIDIDTDNNFEFLFLTEEEAKNEFRKNDNKENEPCFWFKVGKVLQWHSDPDIDAIYDDLLSSLTNQELILKFKESKRFIKKALRDFHKRITEEKLINYFKVTKDELDDILKIFIRVNSGGTILSKTDLLFSTIVATWEDGRDEIEDFIKNLNNLGEGFAFNNDFLMRACLVLSDLPVLFKVNSFKSDNVELIKNNWPEIKMSLQKTVNLLVSFGFNRSLLTSQNAVIIIAYHFMKGGNDAEKSIQGIRKYLLHALLKNIYGGQGDQVIASLRSGLRTEDQSKKYVLKNKSFDFDTVKLNKLPANKTLNIEKEDIEEFMSYKKGANSFFVLSLLYPNLKFTQVHFHQDHIHPNSGFTDSKLKKIGLDDNAINRWKEMKDTVPNLQLMEGRENESKNAKSFTNWLDGEDSKGRKNVPDKIKFLSDNYISDKIDLNFQNFMEFYQVREEQLKKELSKILGVN